MLSNTYDEGTVSIISEKKDNQAIVSIKDIGRGIDLEILPKLFSKFVSKSFAWDRSWIVYF